MKKTLLSIAALSLVIGSSIATAQAAGASPTTAGKQVKPAAKHHTHHKHAAKKAS